MCPVGSVFLENLSTLDLYQIQFELIFKECPPAKILRKIAPAEECGEKGGEGETGSSNSA